MSCCLCRWLSARLFARVHMHNLVYNASWEDPRVDKEALNLGPGDDLLVITSAGCNVLSYALESPRSICAVDMNYRQNALLELKIAGIKELDYETFFRIFGTGRCPEIREIYRTKLRGRLTGPAQKFWDHKISLYFNGKYSFYFRGTSGFFARNMNRYLNWRGARGEIDRLLNAASLEEQREIWPRLKRRLFSRCVRFVMNRDLTLALLGVPHAQRLQIEQTHAGQVSRFAEESLDAVFGNLPISDNYFWRLYATGSYTQTCCPDYLSRGNFQRLKEGLVGKIHIATDTIEGFLRKHEGKFTRFVLLDHMDWLSDRRRDLLAAEWRAILDRAEPGARAIWRCAGPSAEYILSVPVETPDRTRPLGDLLHLHRDLAVELHKKDRVHTYGSFYIADLPGR